ncbi:MAG: bifunctional 5,6,7,8-tetrahydromethanopterin hydro-lyase/3-hexulose-6-phosphate synthase [Methanobrevibacter arboriphilus]|uniref:3-hexulose-6-phosphate synthase n=2 Tax=Methanobrevibacter arboriphilus TaxID=39441 RepID=A0ACA8R456_METAZ|nr:bifunctional 5,6,7,8-tetrahydromethanopterin hydro-lyase/3-hexulose-6-phosphate synthase [Methanobrevibacter arboriphilus]MBF4468714.1 bifunctional 5,6,7,8-tetrahydromethanopterin hydro-lyase/3-hexulose-6-phosphate synthase [Methanobrevibacter arboriphilus]MCC7562470.1 bifunctional 5,6,7,8-tetrahydromethanopterin hydro-lyase/3-hexulose-6-phosphate synthase [Methanobrevibacter arboriphilus]BBL62148.1 3-hexulose-6-phosphate synthase [Methanobrevibacter arboriphilus]GLI11819.1 3-hexulose-6-phos
MYKIGEALVGDGNELAHVDLIIGDKEGPAGTAFANGMTQLSIGHTPLLSVIRPNLMTKPATLIIPKVTVGDLDDASKIFGPAQTAVGRAVADAVEEGLIPKDIAEDIVIMVSVFIHPDAEDYRKIYQYNYGATKLAIRRAMSDYPGINKVLAEKDRGTHPIMGFKVTRLWSPPYVQVALDLDNLDAMEKIISAVPDRERILLEAGTPLIKKFGVGVVSKIRKLRPDAFIIADLKTLDVGRVEIKMAADETADAVAISGLGTIESIEKAIHEAQKQGIYSILDMMNVDNFKEKINKLQDNLKPNIVLLHRNVDLETSMAEKGQDTSDMTEWGNIKEIKKLIGDGLVAVAGGITPEKVDEAIESGADIIVVGRYIIGSRDVRRSAEDFLAHLPQDPDNMRLALDEDEQV